MLKPGIPSDPMTTIRTAWGEDAPEEVVALAEACLELGTQTRVARKLKLSNTVISQVLGRKYAGSYQNVYSAVRASFMREAVLCPVLGAITGAECTDHQRVVDPAQGKQTQIYRACRDGCPHSSIAPYPHVRMRKATTPKPEQMEPDHAAD